MERRFWMHKAKDELRWWWHWESNCFHLQLAIPTHFHVGFGIDNGGEHTLHGDFCGIFWHLDSPRLSQAIDRLIGNVGEKRSWKLLQRSFRFYWHDLGLWLQLWGNDYESNWNDPRWMRMHHLNFPDLLLGRAKYSDVDGEKFENVVIPLPEGNYKATMTFETSTWKRPRWFPRVRKFTKIEITGDVPRFPGKGENSWDQGDDGIWMTSVVGHSLPKAIGGYVEKVMYNREKRSGRRSLIHTN